MVPGIKLTWLLPHHIFPNWRQELWLVRRIFKR